MWLAIYGIVATLSWVVVSMYIVVNSGRVRYLRDVPPKRGPATPSVAIVVAVRNEEAEVEQALGSVLRLDYPHLQIIVVNDRSTDGTPAILERMARANPALRLITIKDLPEGWLGKNHALYQGYRAASADWLLFTDADVVFNRQALRKAMKYVQEKDLDHLAVMPEVTSRSVLFKSVMSTFALMMDVRQRPWAIANPRSSASIGIGAFNLARRGAYEKVGTHAALSLRPDDDLKLGERIKAAGLRQDVAYGDGEVWLEWYTSLGAFVQGLMKNTFSVANYRLWMALGMALSSLLVFVLPLPALLWWGGAGWVLAGVLVAAQVGLMVFKKGIQGRWWHGLMVPLAGGVMAYIIIVSAIKTLVQGGIYWRGTFYPLAELRKTPNP